ncbi:MAG: hypothetical protein HQK51_11220 [Oligoflexia bacterium]|nr:hypothetical protein [Oligoflexia bacterium]
MKLLSFLFLIPIINLLVHSIVMRLFLKKYQRPPVQKITLFFQIIFIICMSLVVWILFADVVETYQLYYSCIFITLCAYCYFHLFNMSITARRINILVSIFKMKGITSVECIKNNHDNNKALEERVDRLIDLGVIVKDKDQRFSSGKNIIFYLFYISVKIINLFRKLLNYEQTKN